MAPAAYDEIADWYEQEFLAGIAAPGLDRLGIDAALDRLLGRGTGACLEIGCGTGVRAGRVRDLGWTPFGIDISAAMLRHARGRRSCWPSAHASTHERGQIRGRPRHRCSG